MPLMNRDGVSNHYRGHAIDASYLVSNHLAKRYRREEYLKSANQKQESPVAQCLLTDRNEMNNCYRGPSIDVSYQVSVHLAEGF